ncbi:MAG: carbohydrate ABC transporter permease [Anaerolineae bacterium]
MARRTPLQRRRVIVAYLFLLPTLAGLIVFLFVPLVWGIGISFTNYVPGVPWRWVGLENYRRVFTDEVVRISARNVLKYVIGVIPFLISVPLLVAFLLNREFWGIGVFRSAIYFPHITSMVVVATVFIYIYRFDGPLNQILSRFFDLFGLKWRRIAFLQNAAWAMAAVVFLTWFKSTGYYSVLYLAGLQNVPADLVEAAMIDGAGWWQRLWFVILPLIRPMATLVVVICTIGAVKLFGEVFVMTGGGPGLATQSLMLTVYQEAFQMLHFGYASALAIVVAAVILVLTLINIKVSERGAY